LNFAIAQKLREAGVEIPSPQRDVNFRGGVVRVEMTPSAKNAGARGCGRCVRDDDNFF